MNKLNENIFHQYNKWKKGYMRHENGHAYQSFYGRVILKGKHNIDDIDDTAYRILCKAYDKWECESDIWDVLEIEPTYNEKLYDKIKNDEHQYKYWISENDGVYVCMCFLEYDEIKNEKYIDTDEWDEDDYIAIIKLIAMYMREKDVKFRKGLFGLVSETLVIYHGNELRLTKMQKECLDVDLHELNDEFEKKFHISFFYYYDELNNIYVKFSDSAIANYKEMKEWIKEKYEAIIK